MDELFGVANFSGIEDIGVAAHHGKGDIYDTTQIEDRHGSDSKAV